MKITHLAYPKTHCVAHVRNLRCFYTRLKIEDYVEYRTLAWGGTHRTQLHRLKTLAADWFRWNRWKQWRHSYRHRSAAIVLPWFPVIVPSLPGMG